MNFRRGSESLDTRTLRYLNPRGRTCPMMLRYPHSIGILELLVALGLVGSPILAIEEVALLFSSVQRALEPAP
jgi:hypothetical protein